MTFADCAGCLLAANVAAGIGFVVTTCAKKREGLWGGVAASFLLGIIVLCVMKSGV